MDRNKVRVDLKHKQCTIIQCIDSIFLVFKEIHKKSGIEELRLFDEYFCIYTPKSFRKILSLYQIYTVVKKRWITLYFRHFLNSPPK